MVTIIPQEYIPIARLDDTLFINITFDRPLIVVLYITYQTLPRLSLQFYANSHLTEVTMTHQEIQGNTLILPLEGFLTRINRRLHKLIPYREMFYDFGKRDYFIRVVNAGQGDHLATQGPYYYVYMVGLARMINLLTMGERPYRSIALRSRKGQLFEEALLPRHLIFNVVTPVLQDAIKQLQEQGWKVQPPMRTILVNEPTSVTAPVTEPRVEYDIDPEAGEAH